ncbi:hypothetical protein CLF_103947, partial [Clonorchis sinensis]
MNGALRALLKYGAPSCEVWEFVADEFDKVLTTQDIYNYRRKCRPALLSRYKLYTFLITDGMSIKRPVLYAFVESEQFAPMRKLFDLFKEMMGEHYPVKTSVMDKLAARMRAASVVFGCDAVLCYTHSANSRHIFHRMARLDNAVQFRQDLQLLRRTYPRFVYYLTTRWLQITRKRVVPAQSGMVHFGNVADNRLENVNGHLKTGSVGSEQQELFFIDFFLACIPINQRWLSDYTLSERDVPLTLVSRPPPTPFDTLRKQVNRVLDEFQGLELRRATAIFKSLIVQGQVLLRQGSKSANDSLPSVVKDATPQTRWRSSDTDLGCCVLWDRPTTTSVRCSYFASSRNYVTSQCRLLSVVIDGPQQMWAKWLSIELASLVVDTVVAQDPDSQSLKSDHGEQDSPSYTQLATLITGVSDTHTSAKERRLRPNKSYTVHQIRKLLAGFKETKQTQDCSLSNSKSSRPKDVNERTTTSSGRNFRPRGKIFVHQSLFSKRADPKRGRAGGVYRSPSSPLEDDQFLIRTLGQLFSSYHITHLLLV